MSIREMREYIALCMVGESGIPERMRILAEKRRRLEEEMKRIRQSIDYIDRKQGFYDDVLTGKTKYHSNLITTE